MRLVLVSSTLAIAMLIEMNAVPLFNPKGFDSAATASQVPDNELNALQGEGRQAVLTQLAGATASDFDEAIGPQVVALGKADRLFTIQSGNAVAKVAAVTPATIEAHGDQVDGPIAPSALPDLTIGEFCEALAEAADASAIPVAFFARLIWQESRFKHNATSPVGAQGVAQFMPETAAEMGLDDPFDPRKALPASAKFLRKLHDQFGNFGLAAAAYNAGSGRIQNWLARRGPLPDETRNYVRKITGNPAEKWTDEAKTIDVHQELPREAPCEGVRGLSRSKDVVATPVALTATISGIIRKAEAEAARAAAAAKARARIMLAKMSKRKHATRLASADKAETANKPANGRSAHRQAVVITVTPSRAAAAKPSTLKAPTKTASLGHAKAKEGRRVRVASASAK